MEEQSFVRVPVLGISTELKMRGYAECLTIRNCVK